MRWRPNPPPKENGAKPSHTGSSARCTGQSGDSLHGLPLPSSLRVDPIPTFRKCFEKSHKPRNLHFQMYPYERARQIGLSLALLRRERPAHHPRYNVASYEQKGDHHPAAPFVHSLRPAPAPSLTPETASPDTAAPARTHHRQRVRARPPHRALRSSCRSRCW